MQKVEFNGTTPFPQTPSYSQVPAANHFAGRPGGTYQGEDRVRRRLRRVWRERKKLVKAMD